MEDEHNEDEDHCRDTKYCKDYGEGIWAKSSPKVDRNTLYLIIIHYQDAHHKHQEQLYKQTQQEQIELLVVPFTNASTQPRAVVVQLLNAHSTNITMTGPWRTIDITGHTEFDSIDFEGLRNDVGNLNMTLNLLILGDE